MSRSDVISCAVFLLLLATVPASAGPAYIYTLDDGTYENIIGIGQGGTIAWANQFSVVAGGESIISLSVLWDSLYFPASSPVSLVLWSDPNNDGSPSDAAILSQIAGVSGDGWIGYAFGSPVYIGAAGTNFFAGVIALHSGDLQYAATLDQTSSQGKSWLSASSDLTAAALVDSYGWPGNWMVRAEGEGSKIPEPASVVLVGLGLVGLTLLRRRR